jgi:DNA-binding CsgD family transcriptional regulator
VIVRFTVVGLIPSSAAIAGDVILGNGAVVRRFVAGLRGEGAARLAAAGISARERAILGRLADGQTREEIAAEEGISPTTVKRTITDLEARLDAPNQFVLAVRAMRLGVIR